MAPNPVGGPNAVFPPTPTSRRVWQAHALLLLTAAIWGFGFVAQRYAMAHVGPFTFNAARFGLGAAMLWLWQRGRPPTAARRAGLALGLLLFVAASLQQAGLVFTTAGKAGFITGLYVVLVPLLAHLRGQRQGPTVWLGAGLAVAGLYLLSEPRGWRLNPGDGLVLLSAFFWALHVLAIDHWSPRHDGLSLAMYQFALVALLSGLVGGLGESPRAGQLIAAGPAILYGGLVSVGLGYTLQVLAQRHAAAGPAAIILSLEAPFALLGGVLLLGERLTSRGLAGAFLMLLGMILAQKSAAKSQK